MKKLVPVLCLLLVLYACKKKNEPSPDNDLLYYVWNVYETTKDGVTTPGLSYFFLSRYAVGIDIRPGHIFHYRYLDPSLVITTAETEACHWSITGKVITFTTQQASAPEIITAEIEKLTNEHLWIKYEYRGYSLQYKLQKN